jgi:hypothetical protein
VEHLTKLHSNGRLLALPANIRLRWKLMAVANTLAYYITATITAVKNFIVQMSISERYICCSYKRTSQIKNLSRKITVLRL